MNHKFSIEQIKQRIIQNLSDDQEKNLAFKSKINAKKDLLGINELLKYEGDEFLEEVYSSILNRKPDPSGFNSFRALLQKGASKHWIIWCIKNSEEGKNNNIEIIGLIEPKTLNELLDLDRHKFIQETYKTLLWREADPEGLQHFLTQLEKGASKLSVLSEIAYSSEAQKTSTEFTKIYSVKPPLKFIVKKLLDKEYLSSVIPKANKKLKQIIKSLLKIYDIYSNLQSVRAQLNAANIKLQRKLETIESQLHDSNNKLFQNIELLEAKLNKLQQYQEQSFQNLAFAQRKPIISISNNVLLLRLEDYSLVIPAEDIPLISYLLSQFAYYGSLEMGLTNAFKKFVKPGMTVVDVGSNIGIFTLIAAGIVGKSGKVYSFEPTPRTFDLLKMNIKINGYTEQVSVQKIAIADKQGNMNLSIRDTCGHNTLFPAEEDTQLVEVETFSLDYILADEPHIHVIKIDTEGAEPLVWQGMQKIRERNPNLIIFMEFAPTHLLRANVNPKHFFDQILNAGFNVAKLDDISGEINSITEEELLNSNSVNLIIKNNLNFNKIY